MATSRATGRTSLYGDDAVIFVTVGAQMPFDRLVRTVDQWAQSRGRSDVFAQIGLSNNVPRHFQSKQFLDPVEFRERVESARVVVSHAGMGSIITALEFGKPIIVMPRHARLKETRNDHQIATGNHLAEMGRVNLACDEQMLLEKLDQLDSFCGQARIRAHASPELISAIRAYINEGTHSKGASGSFTKPARSMPNIRKDDSL